MFSDFLEHAAYFLGGCGVVFCVAHEQSFFGWNFEFVKSILELVRSEEAVFPCDDGVKF